MAWRTTGQGEGDPGKLKARLWLWEDAGSASVIVPRRGRRVKARKKEPGHIYDVMRDCQKVNVAQPNPILRSTQAPTSSHPRHATTAGPRDVEKVLHYRSTLLCVRGVNCSWSLEHRFCFRPKVEVFRSVGQRCRLRRAETHTHTQVCLEFCEGCVNFVRSFLVDRPRLLDRRVLLLVSLLS